jgi:hypothetical protein
MKRAIFTIALVGLFSCLGCPGTFADNQPAIGQATRAAESWLKLVDAGRYRQSYKDTSSYFQGRIDEEKWVATVEPVRKPVGEVISRKLKDGQYTTNLPGAPDS